jgi:hypothetical protein
MRGLEQAAFYLDVGKNQPELVPPVWRESVSVIRWHEPISEVDPVASQKTHTRQFIDMRVSAICYEDFGFCPYEFETCQPQTPLYKSRMHQVAEEDSILGRGVLCFSEFF